MSVTKKLGLSLAGSPLCLPCAVLLVAVIYGVGVASGAAPDQVNTRSTLAAPPVV
jgi:hypothetical protein